LSHCRVAVQPQTPQPEQWFKRDTTAALSSYAGNLFPTNSFPIPAGMPVE
jgi:hypothetical protein